MSDGLRADSSAVEPAQSAGLLAARVYLDAFVAAPFSFLQGVAWRARGLKLRSRHRLSALAGRSRWAYPLWIKRHEPQARRAARVKDAPELIQPIVYAPSGEPHSFATEASLASIQAAGPARPPIVLRGSDDLPAPL
ncbi:hypothetical protein G7077_03355 [Sphingomonas piscis]|uniref:Uncharacterized protein n=1 Tax=Sphingomonas piscis TaxID=2714943 RepID=A0A6G7YMX8_9SPHN|nr:hypothetical protein [Sphingomonas piscis]QIK78092.1 hypothetical protein G7077_03355 [Sphingomonas piscis]